MTAHRLILVDFAYGRRCACCRRHFSCMTQDSSIGFLRITLPLEQRDAELVLALVVEEVAKKARESLSAQCWQDNSDAGMNWHIVRFARPEKITRRVLLSEVGETCARLGARNLDVRVRDLGAAAVCADHRLTCEPERWPTAP